MKATSLAMRACFARFLPRMRQYYLLTIVGAHMITPHANGDALQDALRARPSFEEDRSGTSTGYSWQSAGTVVSLSRGGTLSVRWSYGSEASIRLAGANIQSEPRGELPSSSMTIYYLGAAETWRTAAHFARVRYPSIYPGIDLVFVTSGDRLEYSFEIAPYANPGVIRIRYDESTGHLNRGGDLYLRTGHATITQPRPTASQDTSNGVRLVACGYRLTGGHEAVFRLGAYDRSRPLFIDPVLNFGTYLGGSGFDSIYGAATDAQGNLYVAGETSSGSITNPSVTARSSRTAFVAKLNGSGIQVLYTAYLGGSAYDSGRGIALDPSGNIYITGVTESSDFPVTTGAFLTHAPGSQEAFVAKLSSGFVLQYSTYLGGGTADFGLAIAVDTTGAAYVAGQTESPSFPVSTGAFEKSYQGGISDCFVSKLNPAGSALAYSTFLGGSALDLCAGIAVDATGDAYVAGTTYSTNFPVAAALQSGLLGTATAFVTKINATGSALVYSTYLGGSLIDNATAIAVDSTGAAYVTGDTASFDFPTTLGVFQTGLNGQYNAFASKLSAAGSTLVYSTLVGGSGSDVGTAIAVDSAGRAIIGGYTSSSNFPTSGAIQTAFQGAFDGFSTVLDPVGATLVFSSYFGGSADDRVYAVAAGPLNKLYLAGMTSSSNFPIASAIQSGLSVAPDAFVLGTTYLAGVPTAVSASPSSGSGASHTFALQYSDTAGASSLQVVYVWFATTFGTVVNSCLLSYQPATNQVSLDSNAGTSSLSATVGSASTLANSQCSLNMSAATAVLNGNTLTLSFPMTFQTGYAGAKGTFLYAADLSGATSGWLELGTWTVP
jgi:Beta-propeller repeat